MNESDLRNLQEIQAKKNHLFAVGGSVGTGNDSINLCDNSITSEDISQEKNKEIKEEPYKWEPPKPLEKEQILPPFPLECLPDDVRQYVEAVAENTATPVDMSAVAALAVIAGSVQKKFRIKGKPDYYEPLNIYTLIIADPGERKSSVMREMTRYTKDYEREVNGTRVEIIDFQTIQYNSLCGQLSKSEKASNIEEAVSLKKEIRELEAEMVRPLRLVADDVTPEALTTLLAENSGALSIISAEGGFLDILAGRYSNTACIDTVLKAHPGDDIHVDRKGRPKEYIRNPALTMLLSVQNDVIRGIFENGTFKGRGLNARFLYSKPKSTIGTRSFETVPIPQEAKINYKKLIYELLDIPTSADGDIKTITLDDGAYSMLKSYFELIEPELKTSLEDMQDWAGKLVGAALRIAGILHCMSFGRSAGESPVNLETMINAITIANYFIEHAKACYQLMGIDENMQLAKFVLRRLEEKPKDEYKRYDIWHTSRKITIILDGNFNQILDILADHNYIVKMPPIDTKRPGKKPDPIYKLNPLHFKF